MTAAPRGSRPHIVLLGRRNAGKSSLANALAGQPVSLVSPVPGTTADPVEKSLEFAPLGPVVLVDTAGLDDDAAGVGVLRAGAARAALDRADFVLVVAAAGTWGAFEDRLMADARERKLPAVAVLTHDDERPEAPAPDTGGAPLRRVAATTGAGVEALKRAMVEAAPETWTDNPPLVRDLFSPGQTVLLVCPVDAGAPKGRLILPQVAAIRDVLDGGGLALVVKPEELPRALAGLSAPPALTVTDSQAFAGVAAALPPEAPLTGFSVLFARAKGDLAAFAEGARTLARLRPGDRVLMAESCAHHAQEDDIGRVKIPRLLERAAGGALAFDHARGHDFPDEDGLRRYAVVVQCGGCMTNRREILARVRRCRAAGTPVTNYGLVLAWAHGILERALAPFAYSACDAVRPSHDEKASRT